MKFVMASAAALVASTIGANAADLAKKAPAAVDYVKVCDTYGAGFFYIPGSDTCLKIGGYARFDLRGGDDDFGIYNSARASGAISTYSRFQLTVDARSMTEYGLLRAFGALNFNASSDGKGGTTTEAKPDKAYIQWGGLTAGYATSLFDFFTGEAAAITYGEIAHDETVNLLAYTYGLGNGVSLSLSVEDPSFAGRATEGANYGGVKAPDLVANIKVDQAWGSAQVMGVAHQDYGLTSTADAGWGFAVGGGVVVKLPMLGAGDEIGVQAVYADGAMRYLGDLSSATANIYDFDDFGNKTKGWSVIGGFKHVFTPSIALGLNTSYADVDASGTINDFKRWDVAGSLTWTPVTNLDITAAVEYSKVDNKSLADQDGIFYGLRIQRSF